MFSHIINQFLAECQVLIIRAAKGKILFFQVGLIIANMYPARVTASPEFQNKLGILEVGSNPLSDFIVGDAWYFKVSSHTSAVVGGFGAAYSGIESRASVSRRYDDRLLEVVTDRLKDLLT